MDGMDPQIALLRQMYMGLDRKSRREFLASIGHKGPTEAVPDRTEPLPGLFCRGAPCRPVRSGGKALRLHFLKGRIGVFLRFCTL